MSEVQCDHWPPSGDQVDTGRRCIGSDTARQWWNNSFQTVWAIPGQQFTIYAKLYKYKTILEQP